MDVERVVLIGKGFGFRCELGAFRAILGGVRIEAGDRLLRGRSGRNRQLRPRGLDDVKLGARRLIFVPAIERIGLRLVARWTYCPEPDEKDEIMFPRGAEITEAENINDDWLWGYYAGQKGLFPGGYATVVAEVGG